MGLEPPPASVKFAYAWTVPTVLAVKVAAPVVQEAPSVSSSEGVQVPGSSVKSVVSPDRATLVSCRVPPVTVRVSVPLQVSVVPTPTAAQVMPPVRVAVPGLATAWTGISTPPLGPEAPLGVE